MKLPQLSVVGFLIWLGICCAVSAIFAFFSALSFGAGFAICAVALIANSFIAEIEDNSQGGFNNPEGKNK